MSRALSSAMQAALAAQEMGEVALLFLTIAHDDLATPIRVVQNTEDVTRDGDLYTGLPFEISLPVEHPDELPKVALRIDNVSRDVIDAIRTLESAPTVTLVVALASTPDTTEAGPFSFSLRLAGADVYLVEGELGVPTWLDEPWPSETFTPASHPGLFDA